jgi:hypothetical protein
MASYEQQMIRRLREEAQDTGHCKEFRDQCTAEADKLEGEIRND